MAKQTVSKQVIALLERDLGSRSVRHAHIRIDAEDTDLAAWLCAAAAICPELREPAAPLTWPVQSRRRFEILADQLGERGRPRAEILRLGAALHDLVATNGGDPELADAILAAVDEMHRAEVV